MLPRLYILECTQQALVSGQSCSNHTVLCMFAKGCEYIFHSVQYMHSTVLRYANKNNNLMAEMHGATEYFTPYHIKVIHKVKNVLSIG